MVILVFRSYRLRAFYLSNKSLFTESMSSTEYFLQDKLVSATDLIQIAFQPRLSFSFISGLFLFVGILNVLVSNYALPRKVPRQSV